MPLNPDSILDSVKKVVGLDYTDTAFDLDVTMFINSALGNLQQVGVGPSFVYSIVDNTATWSDYVTRQDFLGMVKSYVSMSVKLAFDPPPTSFAISAYQKQIEELLWRINIMAETVLSSGWWILDGLSDFPDGAADGDFGFDSTTGTIYVNVLQTANGYWWNLTGDLAFPTGSIVGDLGYDTVTGKVWRKTA